MLAVTRRDRIKEILSKNKSVTIVGLSEYFNVTTQTIRRDLQVLEEQGALIRTHGGAYIRGSTANNISVELRKTMFQSSKTQIAQQCVDLIRNGETIFLDNSTTAYALAKAISNMSLTVITNSLFISSYLSKFENIILITIGGVFNQTNMCYTGKDAMRMMTDYFVNKAFISSSGLHIRHGITDSNQEVAAIRSIAVDNAITTYLIVDHTKFNTTSLTTITSLSKIKGVVTDKFPGEEWQAFLNKHNIELYCKHFDEFGDFNE